MPRRRKGELVEKWELVDLLGEGGNAEIWRAIDGEADVALKILHRHKTDSEPYQRFRQEIQALRQIGPHPCIMPLLDADLPDIPLRTRSAWLAMPIAMLLAESLPQSTLPEVVAAVAAIPIPWQTYISAFNYTTETSSPRISICLTDTQLSRTLASLISLKQTISLSLGDRSDQGSS